MRKLTAFALFAAVFAGAFAAACRLPGSEPEDTVARVGGSVLTLRELEMKLPPELRKLQSREQKFGSVRRWIDEEALAQEARALGLHRSPEFRLTVADFERSMLASAVRSRYPDTARFRAHLDSLKLSVPIAIHPERVVSEKGQP